MFGSGDGPQLAWRPSPCPRCGHALPRTPTSNLPALSLHGVWRTVFSQVWHFLSVLWLRSRRLHGFMWVHRNLFFHSALADMPSCGYTAARIGQARCEFAHISPSPRPLLCPGCVWPTFVLIARPHLGSCTDSHSPPLRRQSLLFSFSRSSVSTAFPHGFIGHLGVSLCQVSVRGLVHFLSGCLLADLQEWLLCHETENIFLTWGLSFLSFW